MQQVGRGMVAPDRCAPPAVHPELDRVAHRQRAFLQPREMDMQVAELLLRVGDGEDGAARNCHGPAVADLAAGLAVERRLVRDNQDLAAGLVEALDLLAARDQRQHFGFRRQRLVAEELRRAEALAEIEPERLGRRLAGAGPGLAGLGARALHLPPRSRPRPRRARGP